VPRSGGNRHEAGVLFRFRDPANPSSWSCFPAAMLVALFRISTTCVACPSRPVRRPARRRRRICLGLFPAVALPPFLVLIVIGILWLTNLYNFMDGSDGLAGGMTVAGFCVPGSRCLDERRRRPADRVRHCGSRRRRVSAVHFPPARLFMGDAGFRPIGFLAAALSLSGWRDGDWPSLVPAAVFWRLSSADATLTLLKRMAPGSASWEAHNKHY